MDINRIDSRAADTGAWMTVEVPEVLLGDGDAPRIKLLAFDVDAVRSAHMVWQRYLAKNRLDEKATDPKARELETGVFVAATVAWEGFTNNGEPFPFTPEAALELYLSQRWMARQIRNFIFNDSNFITLRSPT